MMAVHPRWIQIGVGLIYLLMVTIAWAETSTYDSFRSINVQGNAKIELLADDTASVAVSHLRDKVLTEVVDDVLWPISPTDP